MTRLMNLKNSFEYLKETYTTWYLVRIQIYQMILCIVAYGMIITLITNNLLIGLFFGVGMGTLTNIMLMIARYYSLKYHIKNSKIED
jgi:O-antigen/teichoic acid export membrane protein